MNDLPAGFAGRTAGKSSERGAESRIVYYTGCRMEGVMINLGGCVCAHINKLPNSWVSEQHLGPKAAAATVERVA
jgi:hypothetical protein